MKKKSFLGGAVILAVAGLAVKAIGAVYRIPLQNIIHLEGMAYYNAAYYVYSFLLVVSSAGIPTAISKLVSERIALDDHTGAYNVFRHSYRLLLGLGLATAVVMALGSKPYDSITSIHGTYLSLIVLSPSLLFVALISAYRGYFQGCQNMIPTAVSQVVEQFGKLIVGFVLASRMMHYGPAYGAMGAIIGVSVSVLVALLFLMLIHRKSKGSLLKKLSTSPARELFDKTAATKRLFKIAVPVTIGASIMPLMGMMDAMIVVNRLLSIGYGDTLAKETYGILGSSVNPLINMPAVLTLSLCISLVPAISAAVTKKNEQDMRSAAGMGMKLAVCIGMPCTVGLFILARPILSLLFSASLQGPHLYVAESLLRIMAVGVLFLSLVQAVTGVLQGLGRPGIPVRNLAIGALLKLSASLLLIGMPAVNVKGAAIGTVLCYAAAGVLDTVAAVRHTGLKLRFMEMVGKPLIASLGMGAATYFVYFAVLAPRVSRLMSVGLTVFVAVIIYVAILLLCKTFTENDFELMPGGSRLYALLKRARIYR